MQLIRHIRLFLYTAMLILAVVLTHASVDRTNAQASHTLQSSLNLTGSNSDAPLDIALQYIQQNGLQNGFTVADLSQYRLTDQYQTADTQTTHIYLLQQHAGLDVLETNLNINIANDGTVINLGNRFIPNLADQINSEPAQLTAVSATTRALQHLNLIPTAPITILKQSTTADQATTLSNGNIAAQDITARLVYQPTGTNGVRLVWNLQIASLDQQHWWDIRIDAHNGDILATDDLVIHDQWPQKTDAPSTNNAQLTTCSGGSGNSDYCVYPMPIESPNHTTPLPPGDGRSFATTPWLNAPTASPFGWHDTNGAAGAEFTVTRGNNVHAYEDGNNPGFNPDGGANLIFNFNVGNVDGDSPDTYEAAAISNLFYWNNIIHDLWYEHGFDEASGNFQENNYGNGGIGSDSVNAEAQDGSGFCNANMLTPADGGNPRMQMYTCGLRDGDFDNGVIAHEYWHGISNRLTGGPAAANCLNNAEQGGEGWSDWGALMMTIESGDTGADSRGIGTWLIGEAGNGPGIRTFPYSTNMAINPHTYDDIQTTGGQPHDVGEKWAMFIWEVSWALIDEHGFNSNFYDSWNTGGNNLAMRLIIDGLKLQPCSPGFVDARDAILLADQNLTGGANQCLMWTAFAKRGLGFSAVQGSSTSVTDNSEAFDLPLFCQFLDPTPTSLDVCVGSDAVYSIDVNAGYTSPPVAMSVSGNPAGSTAVFAPASVPAPLPNSTTLTISNLTAPNVGTHTLTIAGDDGVNNENTDVDLNVFPNTLSTPTLLTPADGSTGEPPNPTLTWTAVSGASSYFIEIDDDPGFGSLNYTSSTASTSHTVLTALNPLTTYYWRITAQNLCGSSAASAAFSFTTANIACTTVFSTDVPQTIPPSGTPSVSSDLNFPNDGTITDVNVVSLIGTHTYMGDLDFFLDSPDVTTVQLREQACGTDEDFDINYDDEAATNTPPCPPTDGNTYQPFGNLSDFDGENPNGTWTLRIDDNANFDGGSLDSWGLEICYIPVSDFDIDVTPATLDVCTGNNGIFNVDVTVLGTYSDPVTLSAVSTPPGASISFGTNPVNPPGSSTLTVNSPATSYNIEVSGVGSSGTHTDTITLNLINTPTAPTLLTPADGATDQSVTPTFTWTAVPDASSYEIEIATDPAFSNIVDSATVIGTSYNGATLNASTTYYWHVIADNSCGSNTSTTFSFTTTATACIIYNSTDVPLLIPPTGTAGTTTSDLTITTNGTISDLNVLNLIGTHTYMGDLDFFLDSPDGTTVQLREQACGTDEDFDIDYDDEAATNTPPCPPTDGNAYQPFGNLSDFDGETGDGTWTLSIVDNFTGDTGQLDSWSLEICWQPVAPPSIEVAPNTLESTQLPAEQVTQTLTISNTGGADLTWTLIEDDNLHQSSPAPSVSPWTADRPQDERLTTVMANFLDDQQPVQALTSLPLTPCVAGSAGGYPCSNVDLMAFMPLANIGGGSGNDIWGWTGCSAREFAIMGRTTGTAFVEITDPINPVYLGNLPAHTSSSTWRDIKTFANHAFIVSEASGHGMQVFDLNQLCSIGSPPVTFSNTAHYSGFGSAHNLVINEDSGYAYAVGAASCSGGLHMVDINSPTSPTFAGCFGSDGYTHDAQCVIYNGPDLDHIGEEICFNANEDTVTIVDVTDKSNPDQLSSTTYLGEEYTHQGWLTEDMAYYLLDDEQDELFNGHNTRTRIWDVSDLENPSLISFYDGPTAAIDHNLYLKGHTTYEANYRAGLRILDATNASSGSLSEIGYFDIYPASDSASFNGAWSVYPYFDSDVVVVSGIEQGLFVLSPTLTATAADFVLEPTQVVLDICGVDSDDTTFSLDDVYGFNSAVTMSASGLPTGTSPSFSNNPVTPFDTTLFTVNNTSAATGSYLLTVQGTGGGVTHTEYLRLNIEAAVGATTLVSPADGATNQPLLATLTWTAVPDATDYLVEVATDMAFTNIVYSALVAGTTDTTTPLINGTQYFWRVTAQNNCSAAVSAVWSFTIITAPICSAPVDMPWLSASLTNGTVSASGSTDIDITFDSTGYAAGVYTGTVCINSNDAGLPQVQVPVTMTVQATDYSDLVPSYGTAAHIGSGALRLGPGWTADISFAANNDNATDDGVTHTSGDWLASNTVFITVDVRDSGGAATTGYVAGWVDWDNNGTFAAGEQIFGQSVTGSEAISFIVPAGYDPSATPTIQARFRLYPSEPTLLGTETPTGNANDGEVEDYSWSFTPTAVSLNTLNAQTSARWAVWLTAVILLTLTAFYVCRRRA